MGEKTSCHLLEGQFGNSSPKVLQHCKTYHLTFWDCPAALLPSCLGNSTQYEWESDLDQSEAPTLSCKESPGSKREDRRLIPGSEVTDVQYQLHHPTDRGSWAHQSQLILKHDFLYCSQTQTQLLPSQLCCEPPAILWGKKKSLLLKSPSDPSAYNREFCLRHEHTPIQKLNNYEFI